MDHNPLVAKDFSRKQLTRLAKLGIILVGAAALPDYNQDLPFANLTWGYQVNDNGTGKVWTFRQVKWAAR